MSRSLSPCPAEVQVERLIAKADHITLVVRAVRRAVPCPSCAQLSSRIHSYYGRRLADLPWNGVAVEIRLRTRSIPAAEKGARGQQRPGEVHYLLGLKAKDPHTPSPSLIGPFQPVASLIWTRVE
jgi:hypothetical protein